MGFLCFTCRIQVEAWEQGEVNEDEALAITEDIEEYINEYYEFAGDEENIPEQHAEFDEYYWKAMADYETAM